MSTSPKRLTLCACGCGRVASGIPAPDRRGWLAWECRGKADRDTQLRVIANADEARGMTPSPTAGMVGGERGMIGRPPEGGYGDGVAIPRGQEPWHYAPHGRTGPHVKGTVNESPKESRRRIRALSEDEAQRQYFAAAGATWGEAVNGESASERREDIAARLGVSPSKVRRVQRGRSRR